MHDSTTGLVAYTNRGRPTKEEQYKKIHCPEDIEKEIEDIRLDLKVGSKTQILLMLSVATDEMIRLVSINRSSRAPTKKEIHPTIQYLVDISHDKSRDAKLVQLGREEWISWSFDVETRHKKAPMKYLTRYHRVWSLSVKRKGNKIFLHCECETYDECGWPCSCVFAVVQKMHHMMIKVCLDTFFRVDPHKRLTRCLCLYQCFHICSGTTLDSLFATLRPKYSTWESSVYYAS